MLIIPVFTSVNGTVVRVLAKPVQLLQREMCSEIIMPLAATQFFRLLGS
jgi:hypothetical protein